MQFTPTTPLPPLWKHQEAAIRGAGNFFALFFDPGTGKTRTTLEIWKVFESGGKAIIFAPLNVCRNWKDEIRATLGQKVAEATILVSGQTKAKKLKLLADFNASTDLFLICNLEVLRSKEYRALLTHSKADFIVLDESHNFKTPSSLQTKGLLELIRYLKPCNVYLLSGSPFPQGEMDMYTTFLLLKQTKDTFYVWRSKHFEDKNIRRRGTQNYWPEYVVKPQARIEFQKLLARCSMTAKKDDVLLDLPPLLHEKVYCQLGPNQKRHYETMLEYLFCIDEQNNELNAANVLARTMRLQQIIGGFLGEVAIPDNQRLTALDYAIKLAAGEQFLIWTIFKPTYRAISNLLNDLDIPFGFLTGDESAEERYNNMNAFQCGELRALVAHPKAGGVGVNLTAASYSIHYLKSYNLVDDLQAEARNYRGGSEIHKRITRIDIIAEDTIDEEINAALLEKKKVQDFILGLRNGYQR